MSLPVEQRVIFAQVVEGLFFKALSKQQTSRLVARLKAEAQIDLTQKLLPGYPYQAWQRALVVTVEELYPGMPQQLALEELGAVLVRGFFQTLIGSALKGMLHLLGPERTLLRSARALRNGNNYAETKLTKLGPGHFELWTNEVGLSRFNLLGVVKEGMVTVGAKGVQARVLRYDDAGVTFEFRWAEAP